ncbi:MAG: alpha/beta hydrolase, partial [Chitinophagaceae bacterium]|nr:alpha/beta hydrolase [Chitinophagaceae bacterium]
WNDLIPFFTQQGFRVIAPDQLGWGRSEKPDLHYSFHMLALNTKTLLDSLQLQKVILLGHSMGGMLAIRFSLLFPQMVEKLILENPIGLEDYKTFVPYQPLEKLYAKERNATYESYKKYQQGYYPEWKPEYEQYVKAQADLLNSPDFDHMAWVNAFTYQMIYEQPVVYEINHLTMPVLLVIGQADRTIVGKDQLTEQQKSQYGQYPLLGRQTKQAVKNAMLIELTGIGHIPHIQNLPAFEKSIMPFLRN